MIYLVIGTPRSGTSAVAGVLHELGVHMGFEFIQLEKEPEQTYEDLEWAGLADSVTNGGTEVGTINKEHEAEFARLVAKRSKIPDWGVKVVGLAALWPLFAKLNVKVIRTEREVERCIKSWMSFFNESEFDTRILMEAQTANLKGIPADLIVNFDEIFEAKDDTLTTISEFVGKTLKQEAADWIDIDLRRY